MYHRPFSLLIVQLFLYCFRKTAVKNCKRCTKLLSDSVTEQFLLRVTCKRYLIILTHITKLLFRVIRSILCHNNQTCLSCLHCLFGCKFATRNFTCAFC